MTGSVSPVPEMHHEMRVMNAKLNVMTPAMGSTMGYSGRMAPWMPFAP
jgi:hypothetical protein